MKPRNDSLKRFFFKCKTSDRFTKIEKAKKRDGGTQVKSEIKRCYNGYLRNIKDHKKIL